MLSQPNDYVLLPAEDLIRSYTKESDGGDELESPPARPLRYNKPVFPSHAAAASSPRASSVFSFASSHAPHHSHSSRQPSSAWTTLLSCALTALVTAVVVLLWVNNTAGLVALPLAPLHSTLSASPPGAAGAPNAAAGASLEGVHLLGVARTDSRTLLSVQSAASSSFPASHIPSVATALPSTSPVSDASLSLLRAKVSAGRLVDAAQADANLLIVGVVNFGYLDFALNWLCFARRHGLRNFLLLAVDDESVQQLQLLGYGQHVMHAKQLFPDESFGECGGAETHAYRTRCFNRQTELKSLLVLTALMAGHNVLLSDMDISFVHNPLLYMPLSHYWEMQLEPTEWCTGLYYVQSNPFTVQMETAVIQGIRRNKDKDDQEIFNKWITYHRVFMPDVIEQQLFPLDRVLFPIGKEYGQQAAVVQHNNWVFGAEEKRERQREHGLYLFNHSASNDTVTAWVRAVEATGVNMTGVQYAVGAKEAGAVIDLAHPEWRVPEGEMLQCDACLACTKMQAAAPALRSTWPGKSFRQWFKAGDGYRGPSTSHPELI